MNKTLVVVPFAALREAAVSITDPFCSTSHVLVLVPPEEFEYNPETVTSPCLDPLMETVLVAIPTNDVLVASMLAAGSEDETTGTNTEAEPLCRMTAAFALEHRSNTAHII